MGLLQIGSIGDGDATLTVEWKDGNKRLSAAYVHNGLAENVRVQILDENNGILFEQSLPTGEHSENLTGSVNRYVVLTDEGTDAFELEFVGVGVSFGIG